MRNADFEFTIEQIGGSGESDRPGDIKVINWNGLKDLLIDVAIINPTVRSSEKHLVDEGVGGAASAYEKVKKNKYKE